MNHYPVRLANWIPLILILCLIVLGIGLLSGCARSGQLSAATDGTVSDQATAPAKLQAASTPDSKQAAEAQLTEYWAAVATQIALSPRPTEPNGPIYLESPIPTPTWAVRNGGWIMPANTFNPEYNSCWYGYLSDKLLSVCAGHEQQGGDPQQGVVQIKVIEQDQVTVISNDAYETPEKVGVVHIMVADSSSVTVASEDDQHTFTFDIATRQWITP